MTRVIFRWGNFGTNNPERTVASTQSKTHAQFISNDTVFQAVGMNKSKLPLAKFLILKSRPFFLFHKKFCLFVQCTARTLCVYCACNYFKKNTMSISKAIIMISQLSKSWSGIGILSSNIFIRKTVISKVRLGGSEFRVFAREIIGAWKKSTPRDSASSR